jgi:hypothetical protein
LAIANLTPPVATEDFASMARSLHRFLLDEGIRAPEVQPCPIGDAFVRFSSHLEMDRFILGQPRQFGQYQLFLSRHDEGANFRSLEMDRVVWLILVCYPTDGRSLSLIGKAICAFAHLLHVHPSTTVGRVIVKALVNKEQDIPDDVVLSVGEAPRVRTFTVPIFIFTASDVVIGGDEELPSEFGPAHPLPFPAPHWLEPEAELSGSSNEEMVDNAPVNQPLPEVPVEQANAAAVAPDGIGLVDVADAAVPAGAFETASNEGIASPEVGLADGAEKEISRSLIPCDEELSAGAKDFLASGGLEACSFATPAPIVPQLRHYYS